MRLGLGRKRSFADALKTRDHYRYIGPAFSMYSVYTCTAFIQLIQLYIMHRYTLPLSRDSFLEDVPTRRKHGGSLPLTQVVAWSCADMKIILVGCVPQLTRRVCHGRGVRHQWQCATADNT